MTNIKRYLIKTVISNFQKEELVHYTATDPEIQKNTSDWRSPDGKPGRFSSLSTVNSWLEEGRVVYILSDLTGNLAGIIWFGKKSIDKNKYSITQDIVAKYQTTLGIRLYGKARGQKLSKPFLLEAIARHMRKLKLVQLPLWLEVHTNNMKALHVYTDIGFHQVATSPDKTQVLLLAEVSGKL